MNLDGHFDWRRKPNPFSFYSAMLLLVFVGAALFMAWAIVERPWGDISISLSTPSLERPFSDVEAPAAAGEGAESETAAADAAEEA